MNRISRIFFPVLLMLALVGAVNLAPAQKAARAVQPRPFEPAEELIYEAEFSRAILRKIDVADFRFTASRTPLTTPDETNGAKTQGPPPVLKLTGDVSSKGFFARLFNLKFRERVESVVDPVSFTVQNTKRLDEHGKRVRQSEAVFDKATGTVIWTEHDPRNPSETTRRVTSEFKPPIQDVLSAIYFLRTQPLQVGKSFKVPISDSGRVYEVPVRVVEKKRTKSILGKVESLRIDAALFGPEGMIESEGQFTLWITDDARRIPVSARIKSEYGTFDIKLKKVIRNPAAQEYLSKQ